MMVLLPGCLQNASLAETLRLLHCAGVSGTLSLLEGAGDSQRVHHVVWLRGAISAVLSEEDRRGVGRHPSESLTRCRQRATLATLLKTPGLRLRFNALHRPPAQAASSPTVGPAQTRCSRAAGRRPRAAYNAPDAREVGREEPRQRARANPAGSMREPSVRRARQVLGVSPTTSAQELQRAFRRAAFRWHPDRFAAAAESARAYAERRFSAIASAYELLADLTN